MLECAQEAHADYIVSGDLLLIEIKEFQSTKILTLREFSELLGV